MNSINLNTIVSFRDEIMTSDLVDNEMVMMNIDKGLYYGLQETGRHIWQAIEKPIQVSALVDSLMQQYQNPDRETFEADTIAFLNDLLQEDLIVVS